jgi:protein SCO1
VSFITRTATALALAIFCASFASAQGLAPEAVDPAGAKPGLLGKIGIDQRIGESIPLDLPYTDETGKQVTHGQYFGKRPVILALVYYECPMLCTQVLNGLVSGVGILNFEVGREFVVVAVSFNPKEGPGLAAQKKAAYLERYKRPQSAQGWHFLTGTQASIDQLTKAVGFRYAYDERIGQYAHGAGIELLTPEGVLAKYYYGIEFSARDIRLGLIDASKERIGTPIDDVLLLCYHYDPATGTYGAAVLEMVRLGGILTVLAIAGFLTVSLRRERAAGRPGSASRT